MDFNVYTKATQGEIDVIGVLNIEKTAFICEVVTHLTTGIQYTKNASPDTEPSKDYAPPLDGFLDSCRGHKSDHEVPFEIHGPRFMLRRMS